MTRTPTTALINRLLSMGLLYLIFPDILWLDLMLAWQGLADVWRHLVLVLLDLALALLMPEGLSGDHFLEMRVWS